MSEELLRERLQAQIKNRAMIYYHIFNELRKEFGEDKAVEILKRAIYKRGIEIGRMLAKYAPGDLKGLKEAFFKQVVPDEEMYQPKAIRCNEQELEVMMRRCPLKEAYQEAGLSEKEAATMLNIAAQVDYGTFEGAGFRFSAETWQPGRSGCCHLHIKRGD